MEACHPVCASMGRVIGVSVGMFVRLCVCGQKMSTLSETARAVHKLYLLRTSQKSKNISFYMPHERVPTSGSQEKQTFQLFWLRQK